MAYIGVAIRMSTTCPKCSQPLPINGVVDSILCSQCAHAVQAAPEFWQTFLQDQIPHGAGLPEGEEHRLEIRSSKYSLTVFVTAARGFPRCANQACGQPYPEEIADVAAAGGSSVACPACGERSSIRAAPAWFGDVHAAAKILMHEQAATATAEHAQHTAHAHTIPFHCYHCGGALTLDGSTRTVDCPFCFQQSMLPDQIWARLHPVAQVHTWYVLLDIAAGVGVIPQRVFGVDAMGATSSGDMVVAYNHYGEGGYCIARADGAGRMLWLIDDIQFEGELAVWSCAADGMLLLFDRDARSFYFIDPDQGRIVKAIKAKAMVGEDDCDRAGDVAFDADGTVLTKRPLRANTSAHDLRRYDRDGNEVELWPGARQGFWARLKSKASPHKPVSVKYDDWITVGWDGCLYIVSGDASEVSRYDRDGQELGRHSTGAKGVSYIDGLGVDRQGTMYFAFRPQEEIAGDQYAHIGRIPAGGPYELWIGPFSRTHPYFIGDHVEHFAVTPNGGLHMAASDFEEARSIDANGSQTWRNAGTRRADAEAESKIAEALRRHEQLFG